MRQVSGSGGISFPTECNDMKTIADVMIKRNSTVMRILSVLAKPNGISVLNGGDLTAAFHIMESSVPKTVLDAVIQFFTKLSNNVSQPKWIVHAVSQFLSS